MKKKIIILLIVLQAVLIQSVKAQDPIGAAQLKFLAAIEGLQLQNLTVQKLVENRITRMQEAISSEMSLAVLRDIQSLDRINKLLQSYYCQTSETSILIKMTGSNCLIDMDIDLALINLDYSQDIIKSVFLIASSLFIASATQSDRLSKLETLANAIEKSMTIFKNLNSGLSLRIDQQFMMQFLNAEAQRESLMISSSRYTY